EELHLACGEVGGEPRLETGEMELLEARDVRLGELRARELRQRLAPPERERVVRPAFGLQALEAGEIDFVSICAQQVTAGCGDDAVAAERLPQLRDVHLQRLGG